MRFLHGNRFVDRVVFCGIAVGLSYGAAELMNGTYTNKPWYVHSVTLVVGIGFCIAASYGVSYLLRAPALSTKRYKRRETCE